MIWLSIPINLRLAVIWSGVRKAASGPVIDRSIRATNAGMSASVAIRWVKSVTGLAPERPEPDRLSWNRFAIPPPP